MRSEAFAFALGIVLAFFFIIGIMLAPIIFYGIMKEIFSVWEENQLSVVMFAVMSVSARESGYGLDFADPLIVKEL